MTGKKKLMLRSKYTHDSSSHGKINEDPFPRRRTGAPGQAGSRRKAGPGGQPSCGASGTRRSRTAAWPPHGHVALRRGLSKTPRSDRYLGSKPMRSARTGPQGPTARGQESGESCMERMRRETSFLRKRPAGAQGSAGPNGRAPENAIPALV